jgi:hypothetical protein
MRIFRLAVLCVWALVATVMLLGAAAARAFPASPTPQTTSTSTTKKKKIRKKHSKREPTQQAPTADRISEIQSALARGGYYQGDPNGKWDANTIAAMQKFQSSHGIEPSGKLDAPTLQKLGLGSAIAGVSAPKAVTQPTCCSASSSSPGPSAIPGATPSTPASGSHP